MYLFAGRSEKSKHDKRTAVHIALRDSDSHPLRSLCTGNPIAPLSEAQGVTITCQRCIDNIDRLPRQLVDAG